jgi:glycerol-3-phosphate acyltransferase PlsY
LNLQTYTAVALLSYLLGSIPFGYVLVRLFLKQDIRATGSGNIGATNVARSGAKALAAATLLLDVTKGTAAVWITQKLISPDSNGDVLALAAFAGLFVVLGHCFTMWLRFRGGKGVATALGVFLILTPRGAAIALAVFLVVVFITRYVSLGSIVAAVSLPIATYFSHGMSLSALGFLSAICLVVIVKHQQNIGRLIAGTESKFGADKA